VLFGGWGCLALPRYLVPVVLSGWLRCYHCYSCSKTNVWEVWLGQ